jgi:hypothetical protein
MRSRSREDVGARLLAAQFSTNPAAGRLRGRGVRARLEGRFYNGTILHDAKPYQAEGGSATLHHGFTLHRT